MRGVALKIASVTSFVVMATCIKAASNIPVGELIFARSLFALIPIMVFLAIRGEMRVGLQTKRPLAHILRSIMGVCAMALIFTALTRLPLPEATIIHYANPLFLIVMSALVLKENVRLYRWSAVLIGLLGVLIIVWPRLTLLSSGAPLDQNQAIGAVAALSGAFVAAMTMIYVRKMVETERSATLVLYFAIFCTLVSLGTLPFGWIWPTPFQAVLLVSAGIMGGIGQILLTESYRHADMSVIAPFEYTSLILTLIIGYLIFADVPTVQMLLGGTLVIAAGVFVILREHRLGLDRSKSKKVAPLQG